MDIANFNAVHTSFHSLNCTNSFFIPSHRKNAIGRIYMKNLTCFHVCDASYIAHFFDLGDEFFRDGQAFRNVRINRPFRSP
jgi:hypothetical protein